MSERKNITCKLTGNWGPGIDAHIIPESFYGFEKRNRLPSERVQVSPDTIRTYRSPKGEYDSQLVTKEGESYFSTVDDYAARLLIHHEKPTTTRFFPDGKGFLQIEPYEYKRLKMFFLTLLWRAGVTNRPLFQRVRLGPHEDRIRQMILANDPGDINDYTVVVWFHKDTPPSGFPIIEAIPWRHNATGSNYVRFHLGQFVADIKVDKRPCGPTIREVALSPNSPLYILILGNFRESPLYEPVKRVALHLLKGERNPATTS